MNRKIVDYFTPENAGAAAAAAVPGPVSSDSDSDDDNVDAGVAVVDEYYDVHAGRGNQEHQVNVADRFMGKVWETSRGNQTGDNLSGKGILKQTSKARRESKKFLKQQQLEEQRRQQILQQQQLEEQQRQQQLLQQQQQQQQQQQHREIERRVDHASTPLFLDKKFYATTQDDPRALAAADLWTFMDRSATAQTPEALSQRGAITKQQPRREGGGRYTKKKSKKSKKSKRKSNKHKMQKKKTRRSRRLVK